MLSGFGNLILQYILHRIFTDRVHHAFDAARRNAALMPA